MARKDEDTFEAGTDRETERLPGRAVERREASTPDAHTAEYPEVAGGAGGRDGWQGPELDEEIGKPLDPRRRAERREPDREREPAAATRAGGGAMRGVFWLVATIGLVVALVLGAKAVGFWPDLKNPFGSKTQDRSGPALLKSVQDLNQFVAAQGNFDVIVDVQHDRKYIPDFLVNDRILFVASGSVEVYVDFASIGQGAVKESDDRRTVEISLPAPQLRPVRIDNDRSYVYEESKGALNHLGDAFKSDPNRLQEVYKLAEDKIGAAAKDANLSKRAQDNTTQMLRQFLGALGYTSITVKFPAS
jgi:hypothetical protein